LDNILERQMKMVKPLSNVLILTGHSGAGKDAVSAQLQTTAGIASITPHTSRMMREGESEGDPYYFISVGEFLAMREKGEFIEHASYITQFNGIPATAYYGTAFSSIPNDKMSIITIGVNAGKELKSKLGDRALLVYLHVDDTTREQRAVERGSFDQTEWDNRLAQDHKRFNNEVPVGMDIIIDNTTPITTTIQNILKYIKYYY